MARLDAVIIMGAIGVMMGIVIMVGLLIQPEPDLYCYSITDSNGAVHESYEPVTPSEFGLAWRRDAEWGAVQDPVAVTVDRDCLRERGITFDEIVEE